MRKVETRSGFTGLLEQPVGVRTSAPDARLVQRHSDEPLLLKNPHDGLGGSSIGDFRYPSTYPIDPRGQHSQISLRRWGFGGLRLALVAGIIGCFVFAVTSDFGKLSASALPFWQDADRIAGAVGLGIDQISLRGHHHTPEGDVFDALQLDKQRSFVSFDSAAALVRLQDLAWVKSASIVRALPGKLDVRLVEREPFALWQDGTDLFLIDARGRVLSTTEKRYAPNLPIITGKDAAREVAPLMRTIASFEFIATRLVSAQRVSTRRWTLHLLNGVTLHLPAQGAASAIALIRSNRKLRDLVSLPDTVLDFRVVGRVAVRTGTGGATSVRVTTPGAQPLRRGPG